MTYPFQDDDRKLRPRLTSVEIAAIAAKTASEAIKGTRDDVVRQTPTAITDIEPIGGGGVEEYTPASAVIATNISITGLEVSGVPVATPPTSVVDNNGDPVLSVAGVADIPPP